MSFGNWLRDKVASWLLGKAWEDAPPEPPPVDRVEPAPVDSQLLGPEAASMLAESSRLSPEPEPPPPPLEGSAEERLARLRRR